MTTVLLPVLPLRETVVFPRLTSPSITVGRDQSLGVLDIVSQQGGEIFAVCQREPTNDAPTPEDLFDVGVSALIEELAIDGDTGFRRVRLTPLWRGRAVAFTRTSPHIEAEVLRLEEECTATNIAELAELLKARFAEHCKTEPEKWESPLRILRTITEPSMLADFVASKLRLGVMENQQLLETLDISSRLEQVLRILDREENLLGLHETLTAKVRSQLTKAQREYYLRQQMKAIQEELGNDGQIERTNSIRPIFTSRVSTIDARLCFILMPFNEPWSDRLYFKLIRPTIEELGMQCIRADNLTGQIIVEDIWTKINQCGVIVADVTGRNPNVMYELGIVHTIGKPTILITQDIHGVPFDFAHLRHYPYEDNIDGFRDLADTLRRVLASIVSESYNIDLSSAKREALPGFDQ